MTREEIIQGLYRGDGRAIKEAVKALEQKPNDDCVSRSMAINKLKEHYFDEKLQSAKDDPCVIDAMTDLDIRIIKELPPVTPTKCIATVKFSKEDMQKLIDEKMKEIVVGHKRGHWINIDETHSKCDKCESVFEIASANGEANYCPNCGCFMSKGGNHEH